tara:strand:+ start:2309 stop:3679 length:1371 start_codon:yes stop_codon:yes gene_type:complete
MTGYIKTMKDLEAATYGLRGSSALLKSAGIVGGFGTPHDDASGNPFSGSAASNLGDLYNVLYGQKVWSMLNQEVNALSIMAKRPYTSSGWRVLKSRPQGGSGSSFGIGAGAVGSAAPKADLIGGVPENESLSNISALAPEYAKLYISPKTVAHKFEFSELGMELAAIDDGVGDIRAIVREDMGKHHAESQNVMLLMPLEKMSDLQGATNTDRNYTSLFKIVSSAEEIGQMYLDNVTELGADDSGTPAVSPELTRIFGDVRPVAIGGSHGSETATATASFLDAEVDFGTGYADGTARVLTLSILNDMIRRIRQNGGSPKVMITGYDTIQHISDLLQSQERFMDRKEIVPTHNGVRGPKGAEVGFRVATYYDIPIIPAKDMPSTGLSTSNRLTDILLLDTDHLWLSVMKPTQYFEDGISNGNPFGVGKLGNQGLYRTMGETACSFFKGQGKITNLKSA